MGGVISESGAAVTTKFHGWVATEQKDQAIVLKQGRLLREEKNTEKKRKDGEGAGRGRGRGDGGADGGAATNG